MMDLVVPIVLEGGNTKPPLEPNKKRKVQISPSKKWTFTWNNYPEDWMSSIVPKIQSSSKYGMQPEVGENGTPHIQGWVEFEVKIRPLSLNLPKEIHWEKMKGTIAQNIEYCSKSITKAGDYVTNQKQKISMECTEDDVMVYENLYQWGKELVDKVKDCLPDTKDRTIMWFWSAQGMMKKTETARYLVYHHDAVVIQGGRKHVLAVTYKNPAPIYILTVPRTDEGYVSYSSIELIKDALYMSAFGTEATGMVNRKKPWVIVMANFEPDRSALSEDRWVIQNVDI
jgi:hypothetical protein